MPFKVCSLCHTHWNSRDEFLDDETIWLVGYQPNFARTEEGLLLFNHRRAKCDTTVAVEVKDLQYLYNDPMFDESLLGTDQCRGHCLNITDLEQCDQRCTNADVRQIMHIILERQRKNRL